MKIDLNVRMVELDGTDIPISKDQSGKEVPIKDMLLSRQLAVLLSRLNPTGIEVEEAIRWASSLYKEGFLEVNGEERTKLVKAVKESGFTNLLKSQLVTVLCEPFEKETAEA